MTLLDRIFPPDQCDQGLYERPALIRPLDQIDPDLPHAHRHQQRPERRPR